jgi:tetratricopeptide (TPR) repeat protein
MSIRNTIYFLLFSFIGGFVGAQEPTVDEYLEKGVKLHDAGEYVLALETYGKALSTDPDNPRLLYEMALSNYMLKNFSTAIEMAESSLEKSDDLFVENSVLIGSAQYEMKDPKSALKTFKKAIKKAPEAHGLYFNQGIVMYGEKELEDASSSFQKAVILDPAHIESHLYLAKTEMDRGNELKSILAWYNYLALEKDTESNRLALDNLNRLLLSDVSQEPIEGIDIDAIQSSIVENLNSDEEVSEFAVLRAITNGIFSNFKTGDIQNNVSAWEYYTDLYGSIYSNDYTDAFVSHIAIQYQDSWDWRRENQRQFAMFSRWLESELKVDLKR